VIHHRGTEHTEEICFVVVATVIASIDWSHLLIYCFALMVSHFSLHAQRKVTKRKGTPTSLPFGFLTVRLCLRAVLTRRPGSTGLNRTSLSDLPYQSRMPRQASRGCDSSPLSAPKTALLVGSIGQGRPIESRRARMASRDDPLAVKMAEGMRSTRAGDAFFGLRFLCEQKR
jgi:hypothetical protein